MDLGDAFTVRNAVTSVTVTLASVARGRAAVRWPNGAEYGVDLMTGDLYELPKLTHGVFSVDLHTGRVIGTSSQLDHAHMATIEHLVPGTMVRLDTGVTAQVLDVLPSEGALKIFVPRKSGASGVWTLPRVQRLDFRVTGMALRSLRERAGVVSAAS